MTMTATRTGIEPRQTRDFHCPTCRRFLGLRPSEPVRTSVRIYCRTCRRLVCIDEPVAPREMERSA